MMKNNWQTKKLGEVCKIGDGNHSSKYPKKDEMITSGVPFIRANNLINGKISWVDMKYISPVKHEDLKKGHLKTGDILFTNRGEIGKLAVVSSDFDNSNLNSQIAWFRTNSDLLNMFLYYFLKSPLMQDSFFQQKNGAALQQLTIGQINKVEISYPNLMEQKRIVKKLDAIFENINKAKENTEKNLQNSKELFESYLNEIFAEHRDGWNQRSLGLIADIEYGFTDKAKDNGDYRYIRITDIGGYGNLREDGKMYIKKSPESEKFLLKDNDLLMARTGATYAKVLLYKNVETSVFASYLIRIKFKENIESKLYWYFTKSKIYWDQANRLSSGSAQPQFNGNALKQLVFNYPVSKTEQGKVVEKLDMLYDQTKKLEENYKQKLLLLDELKKSVLSKAFSGEL